ncbi:MAG: hypothetical protein LBT19_01475 [Candidatus Nomurabacteria bacterium]|jgi:hypothetical protein|nr:hypothetical protein [Candidatus Nomurabacteria bacterium]
MKKILSIMMGLALLASTANIANVGATTIADEGFSDLAVLPTIIYPGGNGVHFVTNQLDGPIQIKSFATFVSDWPYDLSDIKANYPTLPSDISSPIVQATFGIKELSLSTGEPLSLVTIIKSESSNILYYVLSFWDGSIEAQRLNFQNCIDEAGGRSADLECRISMRGGETIFKAYIDGVELVPDSEEDSSLNNIGSVTTTGNGAGNSTSTSQNNEPQNSKNQNVKNTNTDTNSAISSALISDISDDPLPPANSPSILEDFATTHTDEVKNYSWWALLPIFLLVLLLVCGVLYRAIRRAIAAREQQSAY